MKRLPAGAVLREITTAAAQTREVEQQAAGFENIAAGSDEMLTLFDLAHVLAEHSSLTDAADAIATRIRRLVPFVLAVFFTYDDATDELVAKQAVGQGALLVRDLRISLGQRLSGWVAANRQTIMNSDAMLDLGEITKSVNPRLRTCLSTPLMANDQLIGVLTLYSSTPEGFTEDHRRLLETGGELHRAWFARRPETTQGSTEGPGPSEGESKPTKRPPRIANSLNLRVASSHPVRCKPE